MKNQSKGRKKRRVQRRKNWKEEKNVYDLISKTACEQKFLGHICGLDDAILTHW
jgi:hypothetical protein